MPANKSVYNDAIKKGHNAAWDGQWKKAAEEYQAMKTPETQEAERKTHEAKGPLETAKAYLQNPSAIYTVP